MWTCMECGKPIKDGVLYFSMEKKKNWEGKIYPQTVQVLYIHVTCFNKLNHKIKTLTSQLDVTRRVAEGNCDN